ncbi:hypothetical protein ACSLNR_27890, partial [Escherichia coli]|uniref:hypothetical protein n=1 Tax=Escherichia coli TaxID=562 RepID=UPI003EE325FA
SFNALFFQRPAVNEAPFKAMLSHMFVVLHLPAFSQFPQLLFFLVWPGVSLSFCVFCARKRLRAF